MLKYVEDHELRETPGAIWEALQAGDEVAIVADGQPRALMLPINDGDVEAAADIATRVRALRAIARMQAASVARGLDRVTLDEFNAEIAAARAERRARGE